MSSTYRISAVRVETTTDNPHEHITRLRIGFDTGAGVDRATVVANLRKTNGDRYDIFANGALLDVVLAVCPTCQSSDYITTAPGTTATNDLLELRRY
jgi:hypothetical protein